MYLLRPAPFSFLYSSQPSAASSTFYPATPLILHLAGGPFSMQPNVLIMCPARPFADDWLITISLGDIVRQGREGCVTV